MKPIGHWELLRSCTAFWEGMSLAAMVRRQDQGQTVPPCLFTGTEHELIVFSLSRKY